MLRAIMTGAGTAVLGLVTGAVAQPFFGVVPNANATVRGTGGLNTLTRDAGNPRTYQQQIVEAELLGMGLSPGYIITGITWRASVTTSNPAIWPPIGSGGRNWADYEITFAQAAFPIASMSTTFAANMLSPVMVRDGPLFIPEGTFTNDTSLPAPTPNAWGFEIVLQTPYTWTGGDLVMLFTHPGSAEVGALFLDTVASNTTSVRAFSAVGFQATTGASATFTITRFTFIPSPGTLALMAMGGVAAIRRRR